MPFVEFEHIENCLLAAIVTNWKQSDLTTSNLFVPLIFNCKHITVNHISINKLETIWRKNESMHFIVESILYFCVFIIYLGGKSFKSWGDFQSEPVPFLLLIISTLSIKTHWIEYWWTVSIFNDVLFTTWFT